ncbi:MAG: hypothetical protein KAI66_14285, partial [Lentisphaeria bacterium]|nr:hypothetical protein [Lentisphaeria bacterium]
MRPMTIRDLAEGKLSLVGGLAVLLALATMTQAQVARRGVAPIVISSDAPQVVRFAAVELQNHFRKISGEDFPIV